MPDFSAPNFDYMLDPPDDHDGEPSASPEERERAEAEDAYFAYLDALEERGEPHSAALTFEEFCARVKSAASTLPAPAEDDLADDDIPF